MQDKNKLDDMTKRYKDEMMRLYSKNRTVSDKPAAPPKPAAAAVPAAPKAIVVASEQPKAKTIPQKPRQDLSNPPMPEIPSNYGRGAEMPRTDSPNGKGKFPSAEEIMRHEKSSEPTVMTVSTTVSPEARFVPVETERHRQGNYYFPNNDDDDDNDDIEDIIEEIVPDIDYPDEDTDFEEPDDDDFFEENPPNMNGKGYLQIEVTAADGAIPIEGATVIVTQKINGMDSLVSMAVTDDNGATAPVALSAPPQSLSESPAPSERPYSEYNVGVYKKGFYSIPKLTVPIFDTIKSIQPVSLIPLAEFELEGTRRPAGKNRNNN